MSIGRKNIVNLANYETQKLYGENLLSNEGIVPSDSELLHQYFAHK